MASKRATEAEKEPEGFVNVDPASLPDDPPVLKAAFADLQKVARGVIADNRLLKHRLDCALRALYGPRSERSDRLAAGSRQGVLFPEPAPPGAPEPAPKPPERFESARPKEPKEHRGRRPLPASLPRRRVLLDFAEDERSCPCCKKPMRKIGEEVAERLEYEPASYHVVEEVRPKYACETCEEGVLTAEPSPAPIAKGLPGPGLLAHVAVSKYQDHLPLHRQEAIFARHGLDIARSTLCDWVAEIARLLEPIRDHLLAEILGGAKIHSDDTVVPVLEKGRRKTREGRLWVYVGEGARPLTVYDFTPTRAKEGPERILGDYKGYLQVDGYAGYEACYRRGAREVACWAHVRRKFFEARVTDPERCDRVMEWIGRLYAVEREVHDRTPEERAAARRERSLPVLEEIRGYFDAASRAVLPKSAVGEAIAYARNRWPALVRYVEDGRLEIDNNRAERALRGVVIGRKNWLFAGNDDGGRRAAIIYSVIATCKEHGVEPWGYLRDVLARLPTYRGPIAALSPPGWKRAQAPP